MIASPAQVVQEYLIVEGFGVRPPTTNPWAVYFSYMPDTPNEAIMAYNTAAREDGRLLRTGESITHPGLHVRIRGRDNTTVYAKAWAIARRFDIINQYTLVLADYSYLIEAVSRNGDPIDLGREEGTGRFLFGVNARITLKETLL